MRWSTHIFLCSGIALAAQPAPAAAAKPIVAVFDIQADRLDMDPQTLATMTTYFASRLAETGVYLLVPREEIKRRINEQKRASYKKCIDQRCQIELGKELAADKSLSTTIMKIGSTCTVAATVYDLKRATTERAATAEGRCSEDDILVLLKTVVQGLAKRQKESDGSPARFGKGHVTVLRVHGSETAPPTKRAQRPAAPVSPPRPAPTGTVHITSQPDGATVKVDSYVRGRTPLTLNSISSGHHNIVVGAGANRVRQSVDVPAAETLTINVMLSHYTDRRIVCRTTFHRAGVDKQSKIYLKCPAHCRAAKGMNGVVLKPNTDLPLPGGGIVVTHVMSKGEMVEATSNLPAGTVIPNQAVMIFKR